MHPAHSSPSGVDPDRRVRRLASALLVIVGVVVAVIVCWPTPPAGSAQSALGRYLVRAHRAGLPGWIDFGLIEGLSNVVMFVPLGLLGALALRRRPWLVVPAGAVLSGLIETGQTLLLPGRFGSLTDVLHNTVGALLGLLLAGPALRRRAARRRRRARGHRAASEAPVRSGR